MATVFGVISIVLGLLGSFLIGWIGVAIVVVFGAVAIFFRIKKNKAEPEERQKVAAIVCGIIGIVLALITQIGVSVYAGRLKDAAVEAGDAPFVVAGADGLKTLGFMGFFADAIKEKPDEMSDEEFGNQLKDQVDRMTKLLSDK